MTLRDNQSSTKLLRATIIAAIITSPRHRLAILIVASFPPRLSRYTFERIAKKGRKYGVDLVVISQRPAEVNRTVVSQCNNLIAMRLTNGDDQTVVRRLLPDSLGGFRDWD